jgi:hypothetical protein
MASVSATHREHLRYCIAVGTVSSTRFLTFWFFRMELTDTAQPKVTCNCYNLQRADCQLHRKQLEILQNRARVCGLNGAIPPAGWI